MSSNFPPGARLGRYEIKSQLGAGGMGEVYLAQDTKLDRKVALKILPADVAAHPDRMKRFVQEAKAASALNHPNIITIHEIDETDSINFIATEFIDGETLREHMRNAPVKLGEVLDVAAQVASALSAAHAAGIVHRDIKPENIMLRRDGIVKVLDFGLAKLSEPPAVAGGFIDTQAATKPLVQTEPGRVMGTVAYMSPEQVRGLDLDARTDIWSLGVVLYEVLAGCAPFTGETSSHVAVSILEKEPAPITRYAPQSPAELQRIVRKALAKDRNERYQTVRDLLIDLKNLRRVLDLQSEIERSAAPGEFGMPPSGGGLSDAKSLPPEGGTPSAAHSTGGTVQIEAARPTSSAEYLISEIKRHKAATVIVAVLVMAAAGIAAYRFLSQRESPTPFQTLRISQLTTTGKVFLAGISPDGKYIAYAVDDGEEQSLWMRQVAATSNVPLVPAVPGQYRGITFTPDGNFVDYVLWEQTKNTISLYQVSALGGPSRKLLDDVHTPISFSSDGKRFAFVRANPNTSEYALVIANADGSGEQKLAARKLPDFYFLPGGPAWSVDGKTIACPAGSFAGGFQVGVVEVRLENGVERAITSQRWFFVGQPKWFKNGKGLVMTAKDRLFGPEQIWELSYPDGAAKQLTNDLNDYRSLSLSSDSNVIAAVQSVRISSTWVAPSADTNRARQIAPGHYDNLAWTPEGRIVYASSESGNPDVWIMDADGSNHKQLTFDSHTDFEPVASRDGRYVVFISDRAGAFNVWRMNLDGSNLKQLTSGGGGESPYFSPDSKWVLYSDFGHGMMSLWKVPIDGGSAAQIGDKVSWSPVVSPDGKLIACYYAAEDIRQVKLAVIPFEGGTPVKMFDIVSQTVRWTADGRALTYIVDRTGTSNIWNQPLDGGPVTQLTDFKTDRIFWFDWSGDGKQLALIRGAVSSDVVLINDTK
jgi:eukaryotic-like serine/threonine-protein kinase